MIDFIKKENTKNIVIFIHGFMGNEKTWINQHNVTFPELLMEESLIKQSFDFAYFNYDSRLFGDDRSGLLNKILKKKNKKNIDICNIGKELSTEIRFKCKEYENIIIVAHSMGGLVTKYFILDEYSLEQSEKVKLFLSLAVPHSGSEWANLGRIAIKNNAHLNSLAPLSDLSTELSHKWINRNHTETVYFVGNNDDVVNENSAIAMDKIKKDIVYTNDDHLTISKPSSKTSTIYVAIRDFLLTFLEESKLIDKENQIISEIKVKQYKDTGEFDEEEFVIKLIVADIHNTLISGAKEAFYNAEYMTRLLDDEQQEELKELYVKIRQLYNIYFGKYLSKKFIDSSEFLNEIHDEIRKDLNLSISSEKYNKLFSSINYIHKTGMLHQLSNNDEEIIWSLEVSKIG